jgi:phospholipid/cholesterol/gamma-HCH transport system ATP-binding protein
MPEPQAAAPAATAPAESAIIVQNLRLSFPEKTVLRDIDLEVMRGEVLAIMGMSGGGKTSLLKCMAGLLKPSSGRILIGGHDIVPMSESELDQVRIKLGLVFQYAALFDSLSVYENVAFGLRYHSRLSRREIGEVVRARLDDVEMEGTEALYPAQLSGGMKKRIGLARALAMQPDVLLYDEPTSGLDPVIARTIDDLILETRNRRGVTSVVVSHDISSIFRIADHIAMLDEGALIAYGTPEEMRASTQPRVRAFVEGS